MPSCHASKAFSKSVRSTIPGGKTWASEARDFCHMHPNGKRKAAKKNGSTLYWTQRFRRVFEWWPVRVTVLQSRKWTLFVFRLKRNKIYPDSTMLWHLWGTNLIGLNPDHLELLSLWCSWSHRGHSTLYTKQIRQESQRVLISSKFNVMLAYSPYFKTQISEGSTDLLITVNTTIVRIARFFTILHLSSAQTICH